MEKGKKEKKGKGVKVKRRKHPKFIPQNYGRRKRIKRRWRKPRGIDSKQRERQKHTGAVPKIGWRNQKGLRGLHPSGLKEILIRSSKDLDTLLVKLSAKPTEIDPKSIAIRFSSTIGKRKKAGLVAKAKDSGFRVLNPGY